MPRVNTWDIPLVAIKNLFRVNAMHIKGRLSLDQLLLWNISMHEFQKCRKLYYSCFLRSYKTKLGVERLLFVSEIWRKKKRKVFSAKIWSVVCLPCSAYWWDNRHFSGKGHTGSYLILKRRTSLFEFEYNFDSSRTKCHRYQQVWVYFISLLIIIREPLWLHDSRPFILVCKIYNEVKAHSKVLPAVLDTTITHVQSVLAKNFSRELQLPTVSGAFGNWDDIKAWQDINSMQRKYLLQVCYRVLKVIQLENRLYKFPA